jgi:hypothetical protein
MRNLKLALVFASALLVLAGPAIADSGVRRTPCGYQQLAVDTAQFLTVPTACGVVSMATITPEVQAVRYRDDAIAPTATVGMPVAVGVTLVYEGSITKIRFISQTAGGIVNASFYK